MDDRYLAPETTRRMQIAAMALLDSLSQEQRQEACFPFSDEAARTDWDFIPKSGRLGLPLYRMSNRQRVLAQQLIASALSLPAYSKALAIMSNENLLRELQKERLGLAAAEFRNAEAYFFSLFGRPNFEETWGWRVVGHHLSLSFTIVAERYLASTPLMLGAEPATFGAFAPLAEDEELGFRMLRSLDDSQVRQAVIHHRAPADVVTRVVPRLGSEEWPDEREVGLPDYRIDDHDRRALRYLHDQPRGVCGAALSTQQRRCLADLLACYLDRLPAEVADRHRERFAGDGLDRLWFCWAGRQERGQPHYYRLQGPSLLIEFDNTQQGGNHIHTVWRDPENDFGYDLLARHYQEEHEAAEPPLRVRRLTSSRPRT
ncbi:MAG TPA: DUF3500 domain-containing protein [Candidatus Dormibacteraeota bacterium]|nr:DUF3500 domain-containing protein [Candidatus Dormibacteraeota bacterium]